MSDTQNNFDGSNPSNIKNIIFIIIYSLIALSGAGFSTGFMMSHFSRAHAEISWSLSIPIAAMLISILFAYIGIKKYKSIRPFYGKNPSQAQKSLKNKEDLRRNILIGCGILGGVIGLTLSYSVLRNDNIVSTLDNGSISQYIGLFTNSPIPLSIALIIAFLWAIIMPIICYYWYKVVDEQEMHATYIGAFFGLYIYMIGAPTWWILWRGGLVAEPNGIAIYLITIYTYGAIWFWKKYNG